MTQHPADLTPEALQSESAALCRIAGSLLGDAHAAEDAAHDAWVAAMERPPEKGLGGWLSVVTRNFALRKKRTDLRVLKRERAAAREEDVESTADAVARVEVHRKVVDAVLGLEEPYRTTVVLRYWEDLPPRLIAKRMMVPVATVRTRLRRANEQLRDKLDRSCGDRAAWATPLAAWVTPRATGGTLAASGIGIVLMATKLKIAVLCVVSLTLSWLLFDGLVLNAGSLPEPTVEVAASDREGGESLDEEVAGAEQADRSRAELPSVAAGKFAGMLFKVIDQTGNPVAGAKVTCEANQNGSRQGWGLGETDANGLLSWEPYSQLLQSSEYDSWVASVDIAGGRCADTNFVPSELTDGPLVLRLPPTGTLTVRVSDEDNRALDGRYLGTYFRVRVSPLPSTLAGVRRSDLSTNDLINLRHTMEASLDARGLARFPHTLLGKQLVLAFGHYRDPEIHPGPSEVEPQVHVELRVPNSPVLIGRLLGAGGIPLANARFQYSIRSHRGNSNNNAATDELGQLRIKLPISGGDSSFLREQPWLFFKEGLYSASQDGWTGGFNLDRDLTEGVNDLGDVQLTEPPLILSGRIVASGMDPTATAVAGVSMNMGYWRQLHELHREDLGEGRFRFRGHVPDLPLRLWFSHGPWLQMEPIDFELGQEDLEIELIAGGSLRAIFLLDDGPWQNLRFDLERRGAEEADSSITIWLGSMRMFMKDSYDRGRPAFTEWKGLKPGEYRLSAEAPGSGKAMVDLPGITVTAGGAVDDPRLEAIDLRDLNAINLSIHGADGKLVQAPSAGILVESDTRKWFEFGLEAGIARLPLVDPVNLWVFAPGHVSKRIESVQTDMRIDLEAAPEIRFQISPTPELPVGTALRLTLRNRNKITEKGLESMQNRGGANASKAIWLNPEFLQVSPDGSASMSVRFPCEVTLSLSLRHGDKSAYIRSKYTPIDLGTVLADEPILIKLDQEALQAAIDKLRK